MEIEFINDEFPEKFSIFYKESNVLLPKKNIVYTIRKVLLIKDHYFLLLNEVVNTVQVMPMPGYEVNFHYARFMEAGDLPGSVLDWEKVHEMYKNQQEKQLTLL